MEMRFVLLQVGLLQSTNGEKVIETHVDKVQVNQKVDFDLTFMNMQSRIPLELPLYICEKL
jgi:hypothetical protein